MTGSLKVINDDRNSWPGYLLAAAVIPGVEDNSVDGVYTLHAKFVFT